MPQPLPTVHRSTDYQKYLQVLKHNHNLALRGLKDVREKESMLRGSGDGAFFRYKSLAMGACNHPAVIIVDPDKGFYKQLEEIGVHENEQFNRITYVLDAAIERMTHIQPAPPPTERSGLVQNINTTASAMAAASAEVQINEINNKLEKEIAKEPEGSKERSFFEALKDKLAKTKDIAAVMLYAIQAVHDTGITVEKARELLSRIL